MTREIPALPPQPERCDLRPTPHGCEADHISPMASVTGARDPHHTALPTKQRRPNLTEVSSSSPHVRQPSVSEISRRSTLRAAAWAAPVVATVAVAPTASAASVPPEFALASNFLARREGSGTSARFSEEMTDSEHFFTVRQTDGLPQTFTVTQARFEFRIQGVNVSTWSPTSSSAGWAYSGRTTPTSSTVSGTANMYGYRFTYTGTSVASSSGVAAIGYPRSRFTFVTGQISNAIAAPWIQTTRWATIRLADGTTRELQYTGPKVRLQSSGARRIAEPDAALETAADTGLAAVAN